MKKLITVAVVTVASFFAGHASADGITDIPEIINFNLIYQTQGSNTFTTTSGITTVKILKGKAFRVTSKDIIKLIGAAFETNFPSGSQLAFYDGGILIMDATGTNVIFYPSETTPTNSSGWNFYYDTSEGIEWETSVVNSVFKEKYNYTKRSIIHIYLYNSPNTKTTDLASAAVPSTDTFDLVLGGLITRQSSFDDISNPIKPGVVKSHSKLTGLAGEGSIGDQYGILTGSAKSHGLLRLSAGPAIVK
jgi:hypothetical protein